MVNPYLKHYGVLGMRWGVRKDRTSFSYRFKSGNLEHFGKKGYNALFVTGLSGSGKSTYARELSKTIDCQVIELDSYFENTGSPNNSEFTSFLKSNGIEKKNLFGKTENSIMQLAIRFYL